MKPWQSVLKIKILGPFDHVKTSVMS